MRGKLGIHSNGTSNADVQVYIKMILSPAERSYLYTSLAQTPPIRPDARLVYQCRPIEATTAFLPASNGSARMRFVDGSECITSVKAEVVHKKLEHSLIEVDLDVSGYRDDSNYVANLKFDITNLLTKSFPTDKLSLTSRYAFKLYIDSITLTHTSYPLSLISLTCYLALKSTKLPLLKSDVDDREVEEQPIFSDDWDAAQYLETFLKMPDYRPPVFITLGLIDKNIIMDPSVEEEQVLENGIIVAFSNDLASLPLHNVQLSSGTSNANLKGLASHNISNIIEMVNKYGPSIVNALDKLLEGDDGDLVF